MANETIGGLQQNIDKFFHFFAEEQKQIEEVPKKNYRKILLFSLLDALAKCAFPKERSNGKRFIGLIDFFTNWKDRDRLSLIQLKYLLDKTSPYAHLDLKREISIRISKFPQYLILEGPTYDPLITDPNIPVQDNTVKKMLEKCRYAPLIWQNRNLALHEFRNVDNKNRSLDTAIPFFHEFCRLRKDGPGYERIWLFHFPWKLISVLVSKCSANLKVHYEKESLNPYDSFDFGASWFS